ncbi:hypothetical protein HJG60_008389 [Phyllostomus discolor]|uniref:Uncharacterized protein n=1 Tax=Phyllostomus discolor TaxID=89673 RepID=A0A833Z4I7_9CHIR|nr:hypothetical protein HJG60_008389 [Phyllostomus discolor]
MQHCGGLGVSLANSKTQSSLMTPAVVYYLCAIKPETQTTEQVHGAGEGGGEPQGREQTSKHRWEISPEASSIFLLSLWPKAARRSPDPSPVTPILGHQSRANGVTSEPGVLGVSAGRSTDSALRLRESDRKQMRQTYAV